MATYVIPAWKDKEDPTFDEDTDPALTAARLTAIGNGIVDAQTRAGALETRATSAEGNITSQGTRLTTAEGNITTQGTKIAAMEKCGFSVVNGKLCVVYTTA